MLIVKQSLKYIIIIGLMAWITIYTFNLKNTMLDEVVINGVIQYRFNLAKYIQNLSLANTDIDLDITPIFPQTQWEYTNANFLQSQFWHALFNNMACIANYLYMPINLLVATPIRAIIWLLRLLFAILGWPMTMTDGKYDSNLMEVLTWIVRYFQIPYIQVN